MLKPTLLAAAMLSTLAFWACATADSQPEGADDQEVIAGSARPDLVGAYEDKSQATQDLGSITLKPDGSYTARVLNVVAGSPILCNRAPCNVSEEGKWSASPTRLRLAPASSPVRVYRVLRLTDGRDLHLERGGSSQDLRFVGPAQEASGAPGDACDATRQCGAGLSCEALPPPPCGAQIGDCPPPASLCCPPAGTINCMPIVAPELAGLCSGPQRGVIEQHCHGVSFID